MDTITRTIAMAVLLLSTGGDAPSAEAAPFASSMPAPGTAVQVAEADTTREISPTSAQPVGESPGPRVDVVGGSAAQHQRLREALDRFRGAGLLLPDLEVVFAPTAEACGGHLGLFSDGFTPWRITICVEEGFVYEHELAHAWEGANLTDEQREAFMELRGYAHWSGPDILWNQRGIEGVAFIIQQGLNGLPLPPALSAEHRNRLDAYQLLTGNPDPRLAEWGSAAGHQKVTGISAPPAPPALPNQSSAARSELSAFDFTVCTDRIKGIGDGC